MKTKKAKTTSTKAKVPKDVFNGKGEEAKAAVERTRLAAEAKVKALKAKIEVVGANAKTELEKQVAAAKADIKKGQAKLNKIRKEVAAA